MTNKVLQDAVKASLWGTEQLTINQEVFQEMKRHTIVMLPAHIIFGMKNENELLADWKNVIVRKMAHNARCNYVQQNMPINVPYVILKGTSAAKYYPFPMYRELGDIDIMTKREDFDLACQNLTDNGYVETTTSKDLEFGRHRSFCKNGIEVEVHAFFSLMNDERKAEYFDDLIIDNINDTHVLPNRINGLVLLEHISQHMENGIGLRQIIDWMMFVDTCLDENNWPEFYSLAKKVGLDYLAITITRMCVMYFGLSPNTWSKCADVSLCNRLMEYILSCGNFGNMIMNEKNDRIKILAYIRSPILALRHLQENGLKRWDLARKYLFVRPFAWLYQLIHYIGKEDTSGIISEYKVANDRKKMFDALKISQSSKGFAIYKDNRYVKTYKKP